MERNGRLVTGAIFSCAALAVAVHAAAPRPNQPRQAGPPLPQAVATRTQVLPDLTCTLEGFKDAAGTIPLPPGGTVASGGGSVQVFIRMTARNGGGITAKDFSVTFASSSGWPLHSMLPLESLTGGATHVYPLSSFTYSAVAAKVTITGQVDSPNRVKESNEGNNTCTFELNEQTVH
jgi:hypothetical protein